jgi:hypothetical protein
VVLHLGVDPLYHALRSADFGLGFERFQVHVELFALRNRVDVDVGLQSHADLLLLAPEVVAQLRFDLGCLLVRVGVGLMALLHLDRHQLLLNFSQKRLVGQVTRLEGFGEVDLLLL